MVTAHAVWRAEVLGIWCFEFIIRILIYRVLLQVAQYLLLFVLFCVLFVCKCVLPPDDNLIAVNKYLISNFVLIIVIHWHTITWAWHIYNKWRYWINKLLIRLWKLPHRHLLSFQHIPLFLWLDAHLPVSDQWWWSVFDLTPYCHTFFLDWSTFTVPASQLPVTLIFYIYGSTFPGILCWTCDHWKRGITWSSDVGQQTPSIPDNFSCWIICTGKIVNISVNGWQDIY